MTPWPTSDGGAVDLGGAVGAEDHARGGRVVEALGVADVLEADGEADTAPDALTARGVAGATRQPDRLARELLGCGNRKRGGLSDHLGDGKRSLDRLARRKHVSGCERVQQPQLDRIDPELRGELVELRLAAKHVWTAPKPRIAPQGGLFV